MPEFRFPPRYIGDGVFVSFDGYQLWLKAERDGREHAVAVEFPVYGSLVRYVRDLRDALETHHGGIEDGGSSSG